MNSVVGADAVAIVDTGGFLRQSFRAPDQLIAIFATSLDVLSFSNGSIEKSSSTSFMSNIKCTSVLSCKVPLKLGV